MRNVSRSVQRPGFRRSRAGIVPLVFVLTLCGGRAAGQAAAEYGHVTSGAAVGSSRAPFKAPAFDRQFAGSKNSAATRGAKSPHLVAPSGEPADVTNRKALEQRAGADAAKLNLTSVPPKASVHINGKLVGNTPVQVVLPPGTYSVEMEGAEKQFSKAQVSVGPKETREVSLSLRSRYPTHIQLR